MSRRRSKGFFAPRCRWCKRPRLEDEKLRIGGVCPKCQQERAQQRRIKTSARLLSKAKDLGTEVRDGVEYRVVKLPTKRPHH